MLYHRLHLYGMGSPEERGMGGGGWWGAKGNHSDVNSSAMQSVGDRQLAQLTG